MAGDLDAAIIAKLDGWLDDICGAWRDGCVVEDHDYAIRMRAAVVAVLGLHKPVEGDHYKPIVCGCALEDDTAVMWEYPCPTARAIAENLGVEVADA